MKRIIISTLIIFTLFLFGTLTTYADTAVTDVVILPAGTRIIEKGEQKQLTTRIIPEDATNKNVTWSIVPESVATINAEGLVTGVEYGSATVTVTTEDGHYTYNKTILVLPTLKYMANGGKITCNNVLSGDEVENRLTQSSDQTNVIAKMESNTKVYEVFERTSGNRCSISYENHTFKGWYTAETGGTKISEDATFVGVRNDDIETVYAQWTDNTVAVTNLELSTSDLSITVGKTANIVVNITPENATLGAGGLVPTIVDTTVAALADETSCTSSDIGTSNGVKKLCYTISGLKVGTTTIKFEKDGKSATANIKVVAENKPVTELTTYPKSKTVVVGDTLRVNVTTKPGKATNKNIVYESSNTQVISLETSTCPDENENDEIDLTCATFKANKAGTATITVKLADGSKSSTVNVTVVDKVAVTDITSVQSSLNVPLSGHRLVQLTIKPTNATNKRVTWTSSDEAVARIMEVYSNCTTLKNSSTLDMVENCVKIQEDEGIDFDTYYIEGLKVGTATLTAKTVDGEKVATINVTVSENVDENTISYDCNGGSGSLTSEIVSKNDKIMLKKNVCTKSGYTFKGWKLYANNAVLKDSSSKDYEYADESIFTNLFGSEKGNLTLKAVWVDKTVPSPKTGISKPFIALFMVAIISLVAFLAVRTKKVEL